MSINMNKKFIKDVIGSPELNLRKGHLPVSTAVDRFIECICAQKRISPVEAGKIRNDIQLYYENYKRVMYGFAHKQKMIYEAEFVEIFEAIGYFRNMGYLFNRLFINVSTNEQKEYVSFTINSLLPKIKYNEEQIKIINRIIDLIDFNNKNDLDDKKLTHKDMVLLDAVTIADGIYDYFNKCIIEYCEKEYVNNLLEKIFKYADKYGRDNVGDYDICNDVINPYMKKTLNKVKYEYCGISTEFGNIRDRRYMKQYNKIFENLFLFNESFNVYDHVYLLTEAAFNPYNIASAIEQWFIRFMKEFHI